MCRAKTEKSKTGIRKSFAKVSDAWLIWVLLVLGTELRALSTVKFAWPPT